MFICSLLLFFSLVISVSVYLAFFITGSIPFISAYALCPATLCDLGKSETEKKDFSHAYALFPAP